MGCSVTRGSTTVKMVPRPGRLCTEIVPPWASATHLVIASPSPVPGCAPTRDRDGSPRQKRSNTFGRSPAHPDAGVAHLQLHLGAPIHVVCQQANPDLIIR